MGELVEISLRALLPPGKVLRGENAKKLCAAMADIFSRNEALRTDFLRECYLDTAYRNLDRWARILDLTASIARLPGKDADKTDIKRKHIRDALTVRPDCTIAGFQQALASGYYLLEFKEYKTLRVGFRTGARLTGENMVHSFMVIVKIDPKGTYNNQLREGDDLGSKNYLESYINKYKPLHTVAFFRYYTASRSSNGVLTWVEQGR